MEDRGMWRNICRTSRGSRLLTVNICMQWEIPAGGIKDYTDLLDKYPMYQGSFIWDYMDQALYRTEKDGSERLCYGGDFDEVPDDGNFCGDGIVVRR